MCRQESGHGAQCYGRRCGTLGRVFDRLPQSVRRRLRPTWEFLRKLRHEISDDRVPDLAASTAFFTLLMLPAGVLAFVASLGSLERLAGAGVAEATRTSVLDWVADTFGDDAGPITEAVVELFDQSNAGVATFSFLVALWALSRGFGGLIRALDEAYDIEERRRWWWLRLSALGMGLTTVVISGFAAWLRYGLWPDLPSAWLVQQSIQPVLLAIFVVWAATLFHFAPNHRTPWRYDLPGAAVTAIGWLALVFGFALYVRAASSTNGVLGLTGAALAAFSLVYLMSLTLLIGAEINEIVSRRAGVIQQAGATPRGAISLRNGFRR
jgi:membrane protein